MAIETSITDILKSVDSDQAESPGSTAPARHLVSIIACQCHYSILYLLR
jgi:hypothetical protein